MKNVPTQFKAVELSPQEDGEDAWGSPKYKPRDFEALQAYLESFDFKFKIEEFHDEPCGDSWVGGGPQMRIKGRLEGDGVKRGTFEVVMRGRTIEVKLDSVRQQLFERKMKVLPEKT